ncbi:golgin subfamily B member 1 [Ixodes scapularis]|uniref:golgin subfamily B member 1 n=1 Tax=Ixodes scapularis TaxID=6945 RepID=UPI001A9D61B2|nr:golgin subfamily B member 1 [Ixodes scapularis]
MEELEQKDLMIQQLKDIVRANEQILQQKEKELQETTAKFQKLKLQSKAKITQLTHQVKAHESSPGTDAGGEAGSGPSSPAQSEAADRGRLRMLKHQLDEAKQRLEKSERDAQARHRALEATVEQLQAQLLQRDQALAEARPATSQAELPHQEDREKLYAQMVYKDSRILELSREAEALEARILDLQESLREKDQVLQARTRAVQLVTEDLSLRSKTAVDDLDDTRAEMQRLQRDFLEREVAWREREASLAADLAAGQARVKECEEAVRRVESTRFELAARNAELQERLVGVQEAAARGRAEHDRVVQEKLDSLNKELEAKSAALEEAQGTLRETDARILKARALERRRAKVLERELAELKKDLPDGEAMTVLQQRIAELEEEKGALQLRALETEDTLSAQASKLEEMAQKEAAIAELERQLKEAQEEKISLEMRAAELEEQKEIEERKMQSLQQELEVLKTGAAPLLEQELKTALEEEVRRLVSQHEEDVGHAARLGEALAQAEAEAKSATARADELAETLQRTLSELEVERTEATKLKGTHAAEVRTKSEEVERLNDALHNMSESLNESLRAAEKHSREAHDQIEANMAKIEELDTTHRDSLIELKRKSEQLEKLKLVLDDAQQALESKTRDADMLSDTLTALKASLAEAENKHATLEATLSAREREIQSTLESLGVSTLGEVNVAWEELRRASSLEVKKYCEKVAELDTRNKELTGKVESLDNALEEAESAKSRLAKVDACLESLAVSSLEELTHKWNTLNEDLATITRTQKLNNEDIASQIKLLTVERSGLRMEIAAKESKIAELASEVISMKTQLEERELALTQEKAALTEARDDVGRLKKALSNSKKKTEVKFKTLLEQSSDLEKEVSVLQSQLEEKCQLLESVQHALDSKCTQMEETTRDFASRKAAAEAQIAELTQQLQDKEQDVSTLREQLSMAVQKADSEITSLQQSLGASAQTSSRLQAELMDLRSSLETMTAEKDSVDKQLKEVENGLQKAQDERKQLELSLSTVVADLENSQAAVVKLEDACTFLKEQLGVAEAEKAELSERLTNSLRCTEDVKQEKEVLEARSGMLSKTIKELECKLCEAQQTGQQREKEMVDELSRLRAEKVDACKELERANQEKQELSLKLSEMEDKLDGLLKQNEDWKQKEEFVLGQLEELQKQYDNSNAESKRQLEEMAETCCNVTEEHSLCKALLDRTTEELKETRIILAENQKESEATAQACTSFKELSEQLAKEVSSLHLEQTKKQEELKRVNSEKDSLSEAVANLKELVATKASQLDSLQVVLGSKDAELQSLRDSAELQQSDIAIKLSEMSKELELRTGELSLMKVALEERDALVVSLKEDVAARSTKLQESKEINRNLNARVESLAERLTEASKAIKVKEANLQKATEDLKTLMESNEELSRDLQVLQESCKELNDVKQDLELKVNIADSKVAELETTLTEQDHMVNKLRSELEATKAELVATSSKLEDAAGKAEEHEQKLKTAIESGSALVEEATRLQQEKESMASTLEKLRSQSGTAQEELDRLAEVIGLLRAELEDMKSRYQDLRVKNDTEAANHAEEISEKNSHLLALEDEVKKLRHENVKTKEHLGLVSAEIESLVGAHDQQLKELLDVEASLRAEVASLTAELGKKKALVKDLQEQLEASHQENVRMKEQLAMFSTESENMVGTRDQQLKELRDVEASLKAEVASFTTQLSEKQTLIKDLQGQLEASHQENVKVKEQLAMFSAEIENMVQNHDQQLREFSDANMKLESEVANYMTKMADNEHSIQDLETKLECLHQENASIKNQLVLASAHAEESAQGHDKQVKELKEQLQKLNGEVDRLQRFEDLYQEAEVQLAEARGYRKAAEARLDALKHAADNEKRHETAAVMEEVLVQSAAKLQGASKDSQKKGEGDVQMSQSEELSKELELKKAEVEKLKSVLSSQEEDTKKLLKELETVKRSLETAEMQLKSSPQETQKLQGSTKSPQSEGTLETGDELKKLKVAFKKSRGELRLKLRILEDKTKELDAVKAHNNSLQTDLQQMVEALSSEKLAAKELLHKMQDRDDQLALASEEIAKLREECAAAKTDLAVSLERISEERALQEDLLERLKSAEIALSFSQTQVEELQSKKAVASVEDIELLKSKLAQAETELERLSEENKSLLASRSEEGQGLLSELALAKAEMQRMSLEHERNIEASFGREQALQSECEAASALLGEMQAQQAEFSQAKSQEFEALQTQLVSLSGDLAKQLELVDAKVEEADTLKEKFEACQLELERFSAEYCILQDVLLQECGEDLPVVENDSERREFSAFEYLKKLLENAKRKREALENQLAEKEEQFNLLQQNYQSLEDRYQRPLQDLGAFVRSIIEHTNQSSEAAVSLKSSQLEDLNWLLAVLQEQVTSLKVRNELLTQESQQWKSSCEDASEKIKCLSDESRHWQQRFEELAETLKEKENVFKCHISSQTESDEGFITEKEQVEVHAEKKELLNQVSQLKEEMAMLKTESFGSNDSTKDLQKELSATKLKFEKMMMKLKLFREKNSRLEEQLSSLQKVNGDLEQIHQQKKTEVSHLEEKCRALQEEVETLSRNDHTETVVQHLQQTFERAEKAEAECSRLDERVSSLLEHNGKLEIEANFLRSELSSLKEQAEMLVSDNENFQQLAENLKKARHCLEEELKTQHEQHVKATKELENEHRRVLDEAAKCEAALSALKTDYSQLQEKYNQIVYRHRDLQEEFHVAAQEKRHLEERCAQLTEEWATARQALAVFEEQQGAVGQKTLQELQELRQANQQLQERFHLFKDKHLKAEERLVQAPNQEVGTSMERVTEGTGGTARISEAPANRVEIEELSRRYESLVEHSRAKESKWNQEKKQLKHIEEHLKEAAETLSAELQVLKTKHEEALEAKLELRGQLEQMTKDNRALSQQVQNWRSYIKGFEENKEAGKGLEAPEVDRLRLELDQTMRNLHQLGLRNEEMSVDLSKVLEERNGLRHQLSHAQEALRQREDQLVRLQSRLPVSRDSHFVVLEDDSQQADLHQRLTESERLRVELQETVEELRSSLRRERQRRTLIEDEWDLLEEGRRIEALPSDTRTLLLHEDIIKIPPTEYSITRQFRSHAHKLRQWLLGRQETSGLSVLHI